MLAAFSDLPVHLRNLLGPALAETLTDAGRLDDAIAVRSLLGRSAGAHQESVQMIEAEIELAKGETENAKAHLNAVIAEDSSEAARAMVKLINENRRSGLPVDPQLASAADALAVEYRGTELGRELTEAAIRAFSISGQPQITFERLHDARAAAALSDATIHALQIEAFHDAALNADDAGFVMISHKESYPPPQTNQQDLPLPELSARLAMANRLTGLGFADKAYDILAPAAHVQNDETRLAAARVLASQGDFGQALQQIQGLEDATSTELRLNALVRLKRYAEAISLLEEMGRISDAVQLAWIAGDLVRIRRMDDRPISWLASARERPEVTNILEHPTFEPLELGRQMISSSQSMRAEIMAFLD
jgi:predicted negative regulator of RcsB-dependent stress response